MDLKHIVARREGKGLIAARCQEVVVGSYPSFTNK